LHIGNFNQTQIIEMLRGQFGKQRALSTGRTTGFVPGRWWRRRVKTVLILVVAATIATPVFADSFTINSSNAVTFLPNGTSTSTDFSSAFTTANFNSAQTGDHATVLTSTPFYTTAASLTTAGAQWIGTSAGAGSGSTPGYTALYAISFNIPHTFVSGSLTLNYEVDNALGDLNPGVYLNGFALPNSSGIPCGVGVACLGAFNGLQTYTDNMVTADLVNGTNWLYIDAVNLGGPGGLIFSADISTVNASPVPEPSTLLLLATGVLSLFGIAHMRQTNCTHP
jgi:PEP-CTERM motif